MVAATQWNMKKDKDERKHIDDDLDRSTDEEIKSAVECGWTVRERMGAGPAPKSDR